MSEPLDFRLRDFGSQYYLQPQTDRARKFMEEQDLPATYDHDHWLQVAIELNKHGWTVWVE